MNINIKIIIFTGFLIQSVLVTISISHIQNVSAFTLPGHLEKFFAGLFQKHLDNKTKHIQDLHIQQHPESKPTTINSSSFSSLSSMPISSVTNMTIPIECHIIDESLPDPKCTPGSINPSVNQENIQDTICVPGFSKTVRPPVSYTSPLKIHLMHSYGFTDSRSNYELDHLVSLEIGGNPKSVTNLWPEPGYGQYNFHIKDRFENYLHKAVCSGSIFLSDAQKEIANNWIENWKRAGQP